MGTAKFLVYMTLFVLVWVGWNALVPEDLKWDAYPFIFLTLMLSLQASYAAPLILLAQNRQEVRDKVVGEQDRQANSRAHADMEFLAREVASLRMAMGEVATRDYLRSELRALLAELEDGRGRRRPRRRGSRGPLPRPGIWAPPPRVGRMAATHSPSRHTRRSGPPSRPSRTPRSSNRSPISEWSTSIELAETGVVAVTVLLTVSGCPLKDKITRDVTAAVGKVEGVTGVDLTLGVMSQEQRAELQQNLRGGKPAKEIPFAQPGSLTRVIAVASGKGGRREVVGDGQPRAGDGRRWASRSAFSTPTSTATACPPCSGSPTSGPRRSRR